MIHAWKNTLKIIHRLNLNYLLAAGKAYLHDGRLLGHDVIRKNIEAVTGGQIMEAAQEIFNPDKMSMLIFQNKNHD